MFGRMILLFHCSLLFISLYIGVGLLQSSLNIRFSRASWRDRLLLVLLILLCCSEFRPSLIRFGCMTVCGHLGRLFADDVLLPSEEWNRLQTFRGRSHYSAAISGMRFALSECEKLPEIWISPILNLILVGDKWLKYITLTSGWLHFT